MVDAREMGRFIAECRRQKKLTQKQLGERLNVTDRAVSKWETGRSFSPLCGTPSFTVSRSFSTFSS